MKPDHFRDIIATNALYRPGPLEGGMVDDYIEVKHGRKRAEYKHPVMKEILEETHGVMVYQEQVMRILNRLGGIELSAAYSCIKAISKKKLSVIAKFREEFIAGATAQGLSESEAIELFDMIEKFAGYGFNKSHSTAYALIAYMTAYLKAHYPVEFMAALLSGDIASRNFKTKDPLVEHLEDCRRMGIALEPPDVNASLPDFSVEQGRIRFGLAAIKGCGWPAAEAIAAERQRRGPYRGLFDFCERLDPGVVNRTVITALIKAGAFDGCGGHRAAWMAVLERAMQAGAHALADRRCGQMGLFDEGPSDPVPADAPLPPTPAWSEHERAAHEKEVLGFYWSCNPLEQHRERLQAFCTHSAADAALLPHGSEVLLGGVLGAIKLANVRTPRAGSTATRYAMFDLEDASGSIRSILWPEDYARCGQLVQADTVLLARGNIEKRPGSDEATFIVKELLPLDGAEERFARGVTIHVDERMHGQQRLQALYEILRGYPGRYPLQLVLDLADGRRVVCACEGLRLDLHDEMRRRVAELLGAGSLRIDIAAPVAGTSGRSNGHARRPAGAMT
jgi:DNA polymerase-3 subunit alpha